MWCFYLGRNCQKIWYQKSIFWVTHQTQKFLKGLGTKSLAYCTNNMNLFKSCRCFMLFPQLTSQRVLSQRFNSHNPRTTRKFGFSYTFFLLCITPCCENADLPLWQSRSHAAPSAGWAAGEGSLHPVGLQCNLERVAMDKIINTGGQKEK